MPTTIVEYSAQPPTTAPRMLTPIAGPLAAARLNDREKIRPAK